MYLASLEYGDGTAAGIFADVEALVGDFAPGLVGFGRACCWGGGGGEDVRLSLQVDGVGYTTRRDDVEGFSTSHLYPGRVKRALYIR